MNPQSFVIVPGATDIINSISNVALVILGVISLWYVRKEFFLKRRPFVSVEILNEILDDVWYFFVVLVNKGTYPGIAKIDKAILQVGDEKYPTLFKTEMSLAPNEKQKIAPIGNINKIGIKKIIGHEYVSNKVIIDILVSSKFPGDKGFRYKTSAKYLVDVTGEKPIFSLISEKIS